jgi:HCOMODA/2-hydroxy-3-carboxy-muconic semialdehyde decarboxylase
MTSSSHPIITQLTNANHLLDQQKVLDAFGHISVRHPDDPNQFLMAVSKAPRFVGDEDIICYKNATGEPLHEEKRPLYSERFIHAAIYMQRPDVHAICHHHSPTIMPFCIAGIAITPVYQHGAIIGTHVPIWDSRDEFHDTNMLVANMDQANSLARTLAHAELVMMRRHGVTQVAQTLDQLIFAAVTLCRNADYQFNAMLLSAAHASHTPHEMSQNPRDRLSNGEIDKAGHIPTTAITRALDYWRRY